MYNSFRNHISIHQGAVEGCCAGFTKFCASLLSSSDPELREIPAHMLKQVSGDTCLYVFFINKWRCLLIDLFPLLSLYRDCRLCGPLVLPQ